MSSSVRAQVAALLADLITEKSWAIKPHTVKQITTLSTPTVFVEHTGFDPLAVAPVGHVDNTVVVTVLSHLTDYAKAEDALDVPVMELIVALDGHDSLAWTEARKVEVGDMYLGWAITLNLTTKKEA